MAVSQNSLIGKTSGSVGGITFTSWKGINVVKSKPTSVANPDSDLQKMQKSVMRQLVAINQSLSGAIKQGFSSLAIGMSAYNAFTSYNSKNAFNLTAPPTATLVPSNLLLSKGSIGVTEMDDCVISVTNQNAIFSFPTTASGANQSSTDLAVVAVFNINTEKWDYLVTSVARSTGTATLSFVNITVSAGDPCVAYLFFISASGKLSSNSVNDTFTVAS